MPFSAQKSHVRGMCNNNNNGSDSGRMVGFIIEPRGRAELGVAQDSDKSLTGLEL